MGFLEWLEWRWIEIAYGTAVCFVIGVGWFFWFLCKDLEEEQNRD
ncbi:MAG: hypothetical protein ACYTEQ_01700 [Planctomycetota bacterium]